MAESAQHGLDVDSYWGVGNLALAIHPQDEATAAPEGEHATAFGRRAGHHAVTM